MAQQPKFRKTKTLLPRVLTAMLLAPLSLFIIYAGPPYSLIFGILVTLGIFIEWILLCRKLSLSILPKVICIVLGTLYILIAALFLLFLLYQPTKLEIWRYIYCLLFLVWSTDTFAYLGGKLFKGPKLAPSISPHKTWSGFGTGMVGGTILTFAASYWILPNVLSFWEILFLTLIAQLGDLLESKVKRWAQVKDSSALLPGHGGLLDRLDSLIAVAFVIYLSQWVF